MRGQGWCSCQRLARCVCTENTRGEIGAARRTHSPRVLESWGLTSACESSAPAGLWLWQGSAPGCHCSLLRTAAAVSCPGTAWHGTAQHGMARQGSPLHSAGWGVCTWPSPKGNCREHLAFPHGSGVFGHGSSFPVGSDKRSLAQAGGGAPRSSHPAPPSTAVPTHPSPSCIAATSPFSPGSLQLFFCHPLLLTPPVLVSAPSSCAVPPGTSSREAVGAPRCQEIFLQCSRVS